MVVHIKLFCNHTFVDVPLLCVTRLILVFLLFPVYNINNIQERYSVYSDPTGAVHVSTFPGKAISIMFVNSQERNINYS